MNRHQKLVLIAGLFAIVAMGMFPPWIRTDRNSLQRPGGFSFLLQPPHRAVDGLLVNGPVKYRIDFSHLSLQWVLVMLMVSVVTLSLGTDRTRRRAGGVAALRRTEAGRLTGPRGRMYPRPTAMRTQDS